MLYYSGYTYYSGTNLYVLYGLLNVCRALWVISTLVEYILFRAIMALIIYHIYTLQTDSNEDVQKLFWNGFF